MARSRLQERRRADSRKEILAAARDILSEEGAGAMTLGAVAAQVGLTTPGLYHYFANKQALLGAIRRLPDDRQQLILLKFSDALPNAQIGAIMGRSEGAIKSLYHRTLLALREDLKNRGFS